jgi:LPXTG-motif cell wall-anchored protein
MKTILKKLSIVTLVIASLLGSISYTVTTTKAAATQEPGYVLQVRNVTAGGNFEGSAKDVTLQANQEAQLRMQVNNLTVGNDIDSLRLKAFFNKETGTRTFNAEVKADGLPWHNDAVTINAPQGHYLQYVPGSTIYDVDDREQFRTRTNVVDINGTSPLSFENGLELTNVKGGPNTWIWMYFKVKATETEPNVINPRLDVTKSLANTSAGESLDSNKVSTTIGSGQETMFRIVVKNGVEQSTLHNVVVKDQRPGSGSLTATVTSKEGNKSSAVTLNVAGGSTVELVAESVVLKDLFGKTIKTFTEDETNRLFGEGFLLGDIHGTFEYARVIEYKVKVGTPTVTPTPTPTVTPGEVKPATLPKTGATENAVIGLLGSTMAGLYLRKFRILG